MGEVGRGPGAFPRREGNGSKQGASLHMPTIRKGVLSAIRNAPTADPTLSGRAGASSGLNGSGLNKSSTFSSSST